MPVNIRCLAVSAVIAVGLCAAQIIGNPILILGVLALFLLLIGWTSFQGFTLPILLFFLPWSQLLKMAPGSHSFYTFALVLVCAVGAFQNRLKFKKYHVLSVFGLLVITLAAKLLHGYGLEFSYIAFFMLLVLFPVVREEIHQRKYDFYEIVLFFSVGVILAAFCAAQFSAYPSLRRYITVHAYLNIRRTSGFYGDPNFYMAQITAALSGCLVLLLKTVGKKRIAALGVLLFLLLYYGFFSGSKTFVLVVALLAVLWIVELIKMRGRAGLRMVLLFGGALLALYVASSAMFSDLIEVLLARFSYTTDLSSFTTGRTELWAGYVEALLSDIRLLLLGTGFTNVKYDDYASHNTILQILYQFGILGTPMLIAWVLLFFQDLFKVPKLEKRQLINVLILLSGAFIPWLALDALFFDEFFLLQWFVYMGMQELLWTAETKALAEQSASRHGRVRIKF